MTKANDRVAQWMFSGVWGAPGAMELSDQENLEYGKALISAVAGDGHVAQAERDWILGYLQAGGHSDETLAALSGYDGEEGVDIYRQEQELKSRRAALAFPAGMDV